MMKTTMVKRHTLNPDHHYQMQPSASTKFLLPDHTSQDHKTQKITIQLPNTHLQVETKLYEWRQKTQFPIVKISHFQVAASNNRKTCIEVELQSYPIKLAQLKDLPLFKILYLLKQALIGFERLFAKLGPFTISDKMIALNQNNKCKVWCNQNFASNAYHTIFATEIDFLQSVYSIFEEKVHKLKSSLLFFAQLKKIQTFCQAMSFIENYARQNKISISSSCKINPTEKLSSSPKKSFDPTLTMTKSPRFLSNPLSMTVSSKTKGSLVQQIRKQCQQVNVVEDLSPKQAYMKASGDTADDLNALKSESLHKEDELGESLMLTKANMEGKTKSIMPTIAEKKSLFNRKYSEKDEEMHVNCFTPNLAERTWEEEKHYFGSNDRAFLGEVSDDDEEQDPEKMQNLFSNNNWKFAIKGLFGVQDALKKSFHNGKDTRKSAFEGAKLNLLEGLGKDLTESHIDEDFDC